ncbi:unnamed protein product [Diatraea saccharalis]|uniref:Beta-galactosidase n=1 Tax=Diatraea saccharalis TaxID=40085 RepID=A0A9P0BYL6_9NEOP|nr:unnamed protein product [Diatraea saccharalis]
MGWRPIVWFCLFISTSYVISAGVPTVIKINDDYDVTMAEEKTSHTISIVGNEFMLDGQPLHIISGSLHYFRLPSEYWRDRLRKLKAAGLNSVSTYVEWSFHEPEERQYSFKNSRDVAAFVRLAAEEGLHVLLRPGPYICAERDLGGLPYWLLGKYPNMQLRTTDKNFIREAKIWMTKLFEQLTPLLFGNGGPIILVQIENEYGSYGTDRHYMQQMRDIVLEHVGTNALLYTTDGPSSLFFRNGFVSGALTTIDFGPGYDIKTAYDDLRKFMPSGPLMNSEYYPGWLTHWGEKLQQVSTDAVVTTLRHMLDYKINVNIYVFFGGSNFEFTSGANYGSTYQPDITSYDYDAPLSEAGDPTPKYYAIRDLLKQYKFLKDNISEPVPSPKGAYGLISLTPKISLLSSEGRTLLGKGYAEMSGPLLPTFEKLRQRSGLILYETKLNETDGLLSITRPKDWIYVYVDGKLQGAINRMYKIYMLDLKSKVDSVLSLLVENQGRINFGPFLNDRKGILSDVEYNGKTLGGNWSITGYPLEVVSPMNSYHTKSDLTKGPVIYESQLVLPEGETPLDTFLDTTGWGRGYVWVNGYNLGRYWPNLGPQVTLYVPGVWLKAAPASNLIQVLELEAAPEALTMEFIDYPILNRTQT